MTTITAVWLGQSDEVSVINASLFLEIHKKNYIYNLHFGGPNRTKSDAFTDNFRRWTAFFIPRTVAKAWELNANLDIIWQPQNIVQVISQVSNH